jgi:diacylglycerol kinase family enzyme
LVIGKAMEIPAKRTGRYVLVFGNPTAGSSSGKTSVDALAEELRARKYQIEIISDPDVLEQVSRELISSGVLHLVVAAGGDGTASLAVNRTPVGTPVMVLPLGTENLLAKYLQMPAEVTGWCDVIDAGQTIQLDAGQVNGQVFLLMLSAGFDAEVVRRLHDERTGHIRHLSYAKPILNSIRDYNYPELRIRCLPQGSDQWTEQRAHWAFVFNVPVYAGGLQIGPTADPADGLFDVCTFVGGSLPRGLFHLGTVMLRKQGKWSGFSRQLARRVCIEADHEVPFQSDGDPGGTLPVEIEVVRNRMTMRAPANWSRA